MCDKENCDEWLSTRNKQKMKPKMRISKQKLVRPKSPFCLRPSSTYQVSPTTHQSTLLEFFTPILSGNTFYSEGDEKGKWEHMTENNIISPVTGDIMAVDDDNMTYSEVKVTNLATNNHSDPQNLSDIPDTFIGTESRSMNDLKAQTVLQVSKLTLYDYQQQSNVVFSEPFSLAIDDNFLNPNSLSYSSQNSSNSTEEIYDTKNISQILYSHDSEFDFCTEALEKNIQDICNKITL